MKILLVEDEKDLSLSITKLLKIEKYDVEAAFDGKEALDLLKLYQYDLIIMDVMMPKINGIEATKTLRNEGIKTPVLMLTARSMIEDKVMGLDSGADDYLTKPFAAKELLARIRALLRRGDNLVNNLEFADIKLNPNSFELVSGINSIRLTNKEYKLMELFILNQNTFISGEKILNSIWPNDSAVDISVVWVFISTLRKHLEKLNSKVTIKASRGIGYKLEIAN